MGKIKVETCEIEGLKVITPTVLVMREVILWRPIIIMIIKKQELIWNLCRIISHLPKRST